MLAQLLAQRIYNPQIIEPLRNYTGWQYLQRLYPILLTLFFIVCIVVFVIIIIIGGVQWITSGGERANLESARKRVLNGITGLVILLTVFFVLIFVGRVFKVDLLGGLSEGSSIHPVPLPMPPVTPPFFVSDQEACLAAGGTWREFPDSCVDSCGRSSVCPIVITWACDCGALQCWDGTTCVNNPITPTPTSSALPGPIIIIPTPTPLPTAVIAIPTNTPTPTPRPTNTPIPTATPTPRPTNTPIPTATPTICPLPSLVTGQTPTGTTTCGLTSITLSWNPVSSATRYAIRVDANPTSWSGTCSSIFANDTCIDNFVGTSFTRSVTPGTRYRWWVDAINSCGWSTTAVQYDFYVPACPATTPFPTPTPIPTATPTPRPTNTPIPTATPTPMPTATPVPTNTPTPIPTPTTISAFCSDSDGGTVFTQQGTVTDNTTLRGGAIEYITDYCTSPSILNEYYCSGTTRSQVTTGCVSTTAQTCFNGECCSWVGQNCSVDSDCCTNYSCQAGRCVSPAILLNESLNYSCRNYCIDSGFSGCLSIGTDALASNGMAYIYPGYTCTLTNTYSCNTVVYYTTGVCDGHQAEWTRCRCI